MHRSLFVDCIFVLASASKKMDIFVEFSNLVQKSTYEGEKRKGNREPSGWDVKIGFLPNKFLIPPYK